MVTTEYTGLESFSGFDNYAAQSHNTCGQAVIASMIRYANVEWKGYERADDASLLKAVVEEYGPNWPLRNWISNRRTITNALRDLRIPFREHHSPTFATAATAQATLLHALEEGHPVIVLLDVASLKLGRTFTLHWAVVYAANNEHVRLSSWGKTYEIPWQEFLAAWKVWFLTAPYRYYMIEVWKP
jgi:hypothetical protein